MKRILVAFIIGITAISGLWTHRGNAAAPTAPCSAFVRNLTFASTGTDVQNLQKFLNNQGFTVSTSGLGSPGKESAYFGPATKNAVIRFQNAHASEILAPNNLISGTGFVGPSTLKKINLLRNCSDVSTGNPITSVTQTSNGTCPIGYICKTKEQLQEDSKKWTTARTETVKKVVKKTSKTSSESATESTSSSSNTSEPVVSVATSSVTAVAVATTTQPIIPATNGICTDSSPEVSVFVIMGQSNAVGVGKVSKIPADTLSALENTSWPFKVWITNSQSSWNGGSDIKTLQKGYFGPELGLSESLVSSGEREFYIFKYASGGTSFNDWLYRGKGGLYDKALASYKKSKTAICATGKNAVVRGIFWMQGEADSLDGAMSVNYGTNLKRLISQSKEDFIAPNAPFVIGLVNSATKLWLYAETVRTWQKSVASVNNHIGWVETNDIPVYAGLCSTNPECAAHYTADGQITLGKRFYQKYLDLK